MGTLLQYAPSKTNPTLLLTLSCAFPFAFANILPVASLFILISVYFSSLPRPGRASSLSQPWGASVCLSSICFATSIFATRWLCSSHGSVLDNCMHLPWQARMPVKFYAQESVVPHLIWNEALEPELVALVNDVAQRLAGNLVPLSATSLLRGRPPHSDLGGLRILASAIVVSVFLRGAAYLVIAFHSNNPLLMLALSTTGLSSLPFGRAEKCAMKFRLNWITNPLPTVIASVSPSGIAFSMRSSSSTAE